MSKSQFPQRTPVCLRQTVRRRNRSYEAAIVGLIEAWEELPTGSWYAHGRPGVPGGAGSRLWLSGLRLRKADGEVTLLVIDDSTAIARLDVKESVDCRS